MNIIECCQIEELGVSCCTELLGLSHCKRCGWWISLEKLAEVKESIREIIDAQRMR